MGIFITYTHKLFFKRQAKKNPLNKHFHALSKIILGCRQISGEFDCKIYYQLFLLKDTTKLKQ